MDFTQRLQKLLDYYDLSASGFATKIGVQRSSMSHILSGRNKPSLDFTMKVLHTFQEVSIEWLIDGKGSFPKNISTPPPPTLIKNVDELTKSSETISLKEENIESEEKSHLELDNSKHKDIDKIVFFYKDGSFSVFKNTP